MGLQIEIENIVIDNFSESAKTILKTEIKKYAENIVKEANLIEEGELENGIDIEITAKSVNNAVRKNKLNYKKKNKKISLTLIKIISTLSLATMGFFFQFDYPEELRWKQITFIVLLICASITTALNYTLDDKE
ncbi:hypothetical protein [Fusobacterium nucleatum]